MTRLFLAAGVAALAIAMPAGAKPGGGHGGGDNQTAQTRGNAHGGNVQARGGGGGGKAARVQNNHGGGGGGQAFRMQSRGGGHAQARSFENRGGGFARNVERRSFAFQDRGHGRGGSAIRAERGSNKAMRAEQRQVRSLERQHGNRFEQRQVRNLERQHGNRFEQRQVRNVERRHGFERVQNREAFRNDLRGRQFERLNNRDEFRGDRIARVREFNVNGRSFAVGGCPPGLMSKGCMPPGQAAKFIGSRLSTVERISALSALPISARYLYPDTDDYYYRYGDGYAYRVDRNDSLISALLPLAFGGYMPGSYFPSSYMNNNYYVPDYYGLNSFYPSSYAGYGYGYDNLCNRYANGVVYQVDCASGFVEDVIPLYAGGYGVGQMLPTGYGYYNVPNQYRSMYYNTPDYNYWYAPGAIYQYDPSSSLITSVAALLSPGFSVGQQLPMGYDVYNVPYGYRDTYFDTPNAMYRYNNGNIYQVDPTTMLVTAIVASILT